MDIGESRLDERIKSRLGQIIDTGCQSIAQLGHDQTVYFTALHAVQVK
jgi:hypothetical protein